MTKQNTYKKLTYVLECLQTRVHELMYSPQTHVSVCVHTHKQSSPPPLPQTKHQTEQLG